MRVDYILIRTLEASAAKGGLAVVDQMQTRDPSCAAAALAFGDGALIAMGEGRYVNRAVGVTNTVLHVEDLDAIEAFFAERAAPSAIELSAWAPPETVGLLRNRGYGPEWFRAMYAFQGWPIASAGRAIRIETVGDDGVSVWLDALAQGNGIDDPERRAVHDEFALASRAVPGTVDLVALIDDTVVGCASMQMIDGIAWLGLAATAPAWRGHGVQTALLRHRLLLAADAGVDVAAATATPNGPSARNLTRLGFAHVQTQLVVVRSRPRFALLTGDFEDF